MRICHGIDLFLTSPINRKKSEGRKYCRSEFFAKKKIL
jgi:hypothetical protein